MSSELSIPELRELLARKEAEEADAQRALRESVKPVYKFTIELVDDAFYKTYDDSVKTFMLNGYVLNKEELEAVGAEVTEGGIRYLYNTLSGKIILCLGGGCIWFGEFSSGFSSVNKAAFAELEKFLASNPDGGDITDIVLADRKARGL